MQDARGQGVRVEVDEEMDMKPPAKDSSSEEDGEEDSSSSRSEDTDVQLKIAKRKPLPTTPDLAKSAAHNHEPNHTSKAPANVVPAKRTASAALTSTEKTMEEKKSRKKRSG